MNKPKFVTAINCMDGRVQIPIIDYLKDNYGAQYVDMVTEPGPNRILAEKKDNATVEAIRKRVEISIIQHASKLVAIVGHHDCAGNPVEKDTQVRQILSAIKIVGSWNPKVQIIGLWIDENWEVHKVQ